MAPLDAEQNIYECPFCEGHGYLVVYKETDNEHSQDTEDCLECYGIGFIRKGSNELS